MVVYWSCGPKTFKSDLFEAVEWTVPQIWNQSLNKLAQSGSIR